jgi:CRP-like cAMP-binding protein
MEEKQFGEGSTVITQGENGDHLFVVDEGELSCERVMKKG